MDKKYIFQTGHGKGLAKAEIAAIFGGEAVVDEVEDGFVLTSSSVTEKLENPIAALNRMGGIVRITEVIQEGPEHMPLNFEEWAVKAMRMRFEKENRKIRFGLSMHPKSDKILKKTLQNSKKSLQSDLGNLRFVNKDFQNLSSVQAWHEDLLGPGAIELHLFKSSDKWYLSKTRAIQDFEWYSHRDYDRPAKNARKGMFPPKLAQILINLAKPEENMTVFDPFCGSGTVLQEAWLMGYKIQGSDLLTGQVEEAQINLKWVQEEAHHYKISENPADKPRIFLADATKLEAKDLPEDPFVIVSETSLGPLLNHPIPEKERKEVHEELEKLYEDFFSNLKKILKTRITGAAPQSFNKVTMVFTAPYHRDKNKRYFIAGLPKILARYTTLLPLSEHERPSLFYERKDQFVSREIWKVQIGEL